jgi:hypothetical protein
MRPLRTVGKRKADPSDGNTAETISEKPARVNTGDAQASAIKYVFLASSAPWFISEIISIVHILYEIQLLCLT